MKSPKHSDDSNTFKFTTVDIFSHLDHKLELLIQHNQFMRISKNLTKGALEAISRRTNLTCTHCLQYNIIQSNLLLLLLSLQLCLTLRDPIDGSPAGSPVPGILQTRTLEWVAISFSSAWKWKVKVKSLSRVRLVATPWTAAYQAAPSMGFSRQEYWSGEPLPFPSIQFDIQVIVYQIRIIVTKGLIASSAFKIQH